MRREDFWDPAPGPGVLRGRRFRALLETFTLPAAAWWTYYEPIERRLAELRARAATSPDLQVVVDMNAAEIEMYRQHGTSYGYEFFLLRRSE